MVSRARITFILAHTVLLTLAVTQVQAEDKGVASFTGVGFVPGVSPQSIPRAISGDGNWVVGEAGFSAASVAWRWSSGTGIQSLGSTTRGAWAVNYDGTVIGGRLKTPQFGQAMRWTLATGPVGLGFLPAGQFSATIHGMSADGSFLIGTGGNSGGNNEAFYWTQATGIVPMGDLPGGSFGSAAQGVSNSGARTVGYGSGAVGAGLQAFYYMMATGMVPLGFLPGTEADPTRETVAWGISASGATIVGQSQTNAKREAWRWTQATGMQSIESPAQQSSQANDVSADGKIVVGQAFPGGPGSFPFIWDATNGMRDIEQVLAGLGINTGWQDFFWAGSISDDGQTIAGYGRNASGGLEGWVAFIPRVIGDADGDSVNDALDNCINDPNPQQDDADGDGLGTVCDPCPADPFDSCDPSQSGGAEVTVAGGGVLTNPAGTVMVSVPPGSVPMDVTISVTEVDPPAGEVDLVLVAGPGRGRVQAMFDFEPDGLVFSPPATLTLMIDVSGLSAPQRDRLDIYERQDDGSFLPLGASCAVPEGPPGVFIATCTVSIDGFSTFALIAENPPLGPIPALSPLGLILLILLMGILAGGAITARRRA